MKYKVRFFLHDSRGHAEQFCIATAKTGHVPKPGNYIYLNDNIIENNGPLNIDPGMYKVVYRVFCYGSDKRLKDNLLSVEVTVKPLTK